MNTYYADMGFHKFQMNQNEVIYDQLTGKFGLRNIENNQIIQTDFTYLAFLSENFLIAEKDYLNGIIDIKGNVIIPLIYRGINLNDAGIPFFIAQKEDKYGILNVNGTELYPFTIQTIKSITTYNDKVYIVTNDENYNARILKIADGVVQIIPSFTNFTILKNNLAAVYYFQNSRAMFGIYNMENDSFLIDFGGYYFYKPKNEIWVKSKNSKFQYYDSVIDSTLTLTENKFKNIFKIENDHFFVETENDIQVLNLNDETLPFRHPKIESYSRNADEHVSTYGKKYTDYQKQLFKFYTSKDSKKYGIINSKGKIIVEAEKYDYVNYSDLDNLNSYNKNIQQYKQDYLRSQKLDKLFYAQNYYNDRAGNITIFKDDGTEIIQIPVEKGDDCYLELSQFSTHGHLMAKCTETMKIYDLASKKMVLEIKESISHENFKERYTNGYNYFTFSEPKRTTIHYLSNKLKVLYEQNVASDSIWHKMIKGDKVYFQQNDKVGLTDFNEKLIVPAEYDEIDILHEDYNLIKKEGKYGIISNKNIVIVALKYDKIIYNISNQCFDCYFLDSKDVYYLNQMQQE